jgi:hypothetical protein
MELYQKGIFLYLKELPILPLGLTATKDISKSSATQVYACKQPELVLLQACIYIFKWYQILFTKGFLQGFTIHNVKLA